MKKMRLDVEALFVESFDTSADARAGRGTVRGHDSAPTEPEEPDTIAATCGCPPASSPTACGQFTCAWTCTAAQTSVTCGEPTCWQTCPDSCYVCGPQGPNP